MIRGISIASFKKSVAGTVTAHIFVTNFMYVGFFIVYLLALTYTKIPFGFILFILGNPFLVWFAVQLSARYVRAQKFPLHNAVTSTIYIYTLLNVLFAIGVKVVYREWHFTLQDLLLAINLVVFYIATKKYLKEHQK
jgi:hypothetical protein